MSDLLIQEKKQKLQKEIEIAKSHLINNIENFQTSDLISVSKDIVPELVSESLISTKNLLPQAEMLSNIFLSKNHFLKYVLRMLNILFGK